MDRLNFTRGWWVAPLMPGVLIFIHAALLGGINSIYDVLLALVAIFTFILPISYLCSSFVIATLIFFMKKKGVLPGWIICFASVPIGILVIILIGVLFGGGWVGLKNSPWAPIYGAGLSFFTSVAFCFLSGIKFFR